MKRRLIRIFMYTLRTIFTSKNFHQINESFTIFAEEYICMHFFYITNLVAKAPGLNLGKKLSNLLSKR